ncbi:hypothetical protein [Tenacibaculum amylolyticum]|uniref:hypothetical protein n=1 Tax=Tenacibaculum amylolyticum TaxID=104269 RepID=UPI0038938675
MFNNVNVDKFNTVLILISLLLAYLLPFELFLISYAILGPLHYITEINWIQNKSYFLKEKYWLPICLTTAFIVFLPALFNLDILNKWFQESTKSFVKSIGAYTNVAIFISLLSAFTFLFIKTLYKRVLTLIFSIFLSFVLVQNNTFNLVFGIFLPTIIHVYVFTLLFMWYGSIKQNSKVGFFNVFLIAIVPISIFLLPVNEGWQIMSTYVKNTYVENKFYLINVSLSKLLGISDGTTFNFSDSTTAKIQLFISFAYTYHYLNWFSKTNTIGWHKHITKSKLILLLCVWILSVLLYVYNYKLGLIVLLFLSFMHVFLEFPINLISIREIVKHYTQKIIK